MSILSGYGKYKRYVLTDNGYKLCSQWTSSNTVHFDDGNTAQTKVGAINGITDSLTSTSSNIALSAKSGKNLQDQLTALNTDTSAFKNRIKNLSLLANIREDGGNSVALNITASRLSYTGTTYFVVITSIQTIVSILMIQGYMGASATILTQLNESSVIKLFEHSSFPVKQVLGINNGTTIRTKIIMQNANKNYRAFIIPLGDDATTGSTSYTTEWSIS